MSDVINDISVNLDRDEAKTDEVAQTLNQTTEHLNDLQTCLSGMTLDELAANILNIVQEIHEISETFNDISAQTSNLISSHLETEKMFEELLKNENRINEIVKNV